jgi:hypothetical protein
MNRRWFLRTLTAMPLVSVADACQPRDFRTDFMWTPSTPMVEVYRCLEGAYPHLTPLQIRAVAVQMIDSRLMASYPGRLLQKS